MKTVYVLFQLYVNAAYDYGSKDIKDTKPLGFFMNKDKTSKSLTCEISSAVNVANCQALDRLHEGDVVSLCFG